MSISFKGTTICGVRRGNSIAIAGDGQVTMGENVVFKSTARKVRRIYGGKVVIGFAGTVSDAFTLSDRFEEKLTQCGGNLERAAVAVAQMWHGDQAMRQLESLMIVADSEHLLILSGTGEVITPDGDVAAIGSGGNYAYSAALAYLDASDLSAREIAEKSLKIAGDICIYTNNHITVEEL